MKRGVVTFIMLICCVTAIGRTRDKDVPKFTFGTECSYNATVYSHLHQYFISPEGFREEILDNRWKYTGNPELTLHAGYNINQYWNLSLFLGYTGVGDFHRALPVSLRATRYFGDNHMTDRWFAFVDMGSGISFKNKIGGIGFGKLGAGYRLSLSRVSKLDFLMSIRTIYTHPDIIYYGETINPDKTYRNNGLTCSLNLGIGLTF